MNSEKEEEVPRQRILTENSKTTVPKPMRRDEEQQGCLSSRKDEKMRIPKASDEARVERIESRSLLSLSLHRAMGEITHLGKSNRS